MMERNILLYCFINRFIDSVIPAKLVPAGSRQGAGNYKELGSCFHRKPWIPHQVRNDNKKVKNTDIICITK